MNKLNQALRETWEKTGEACEKARKAWEATPEYKAKEEALKAVLATPEHKAEEEAFKALKATPENKIFIEKATALEKTPEYKDYMKAETALEATPEYTAKEEAEEALYATPAYKAYKEIQKVENETPESKTFIEKSRAAEEIPEYKDYRAASKANREARRRLNYESNMKVTCAQAEYDEDIEIKKLKVFISIPMNGKSKSEIEDAYHKEWKKVRDFISEKGYKGKIVRDIEIFNGYVELEENSNVRNSALNYLGASLQKLAEADVLWMGNGWTDSRGCRLEWICASRYGTDILNFWKASARELTLPRGDE